MKKLPIGISDFRKVIRDNNYFVDKSMFIYELINSNAQVSLMPRPRRFGKTLNLSMLKYFFEYGEDTSY
ncbi:MAG: AAA family ATPase, partial [Epsilonproteobacteria bacterium]|nr:AAA family ATPase [Campylobacterota bacterium]